MNQLSHELAVQMNRSTSMTVRGKAFTFQPLRLGVLLLAGLLVLVILVNLLLIPVHRPRTVAMDFETGGNYTMMPMGDNILMYNKQHVREVNTKGKPLWSVDVAMSHPIVETAKDYVLLADLGGNNYAGLYKNGEKLPSVREAAGELGVNPNTIARAYTLLEEEGYVCSLPKKGAFVIFGEPQEREEPDKKAVIYALRDMGISKKTLLEWIEEVYKND